VLILVRHGQTQVNAEGRLQGRSDAPLTELGRQQAAALAVVVAGAKRVVSSPLPRAMETAAMLGPPVDVDERWTEIDYGGLEGVAFADVPVATWQRWRHDPAFVPAGGESLDDVGHRVARACEALFDEAVDANVVVVSHVSPIKAAVAWALQVPQTVSFRMHLELASVCRILCAPAGPVLRTFNETAHLHP
jgi:broad specificity phosphatase PhoE